MNIWRFFNDFMSPVERALFRSFTPEPKYPLVTNNKGLDIAIHQTTSVTEKNSRYPEDVVANHMAQALSIVGVEYNITKDYWTVNPPTNEPHGDGNLEWWIEADKEYDAQDTNLLIMDAEGNGVAYRYGRYALGPGALIDRLARTRKTSAKKLYKNVRANLHEPGHTWSLGHYMFDLDKHKLTFTDRAAEDIREYAMNRHGAEALRSDN